MKFYRSKWSESREPSERNGLQHKSSESREPSERNGLQHKSSESREPSERNGLQHKSSESRERARSKSTVALFATLVAIAATASLSFAGASLAQGAPDDGTQQPGVNLPDPVKRMLNGQPTGQGQAPVVVPPIQFIDVNSGRFGKLEIDLEDAQFLDSACDHLHLIARNMDLKEGVLKSLDVNLAGGHLRDFIVDHLTMTTQGSMRFDTGVLFNQKVLQFVEPVQADITADISQESLNKFINAPSTLDRLSANIGKKAGALASLFGGNSANIGLTVANGQLVLSKGNRVNLKYDAKVGLGEVGVPVPVEIASVLELKDGWVQVTDSKLLTSGQEISPAISQWLVKKINGLSQFGALSDDIHFRFTELKMKPGKGFFLKGTAEINRLRFGRQ